MDKTVAHGIKSLVKGLPPIKQLVRDRDNLILERASIAQEKAALERKNEALMGQQVELLGSRQTLSEERDELIVHLQRLTGELDIANDGRRRLAESLNHAESDRERMRAVVAEKDREHAERIALYGELPFVPNGHFYSPIPARLSVKDDAARIFARWPRTLRAIDLREDDQLRLLEEFRESYQDLPFKAKKEDGLRYYYDNPAYGYSDGIMLNGMLRHAKPGRVIEIGSGYSSCMLLDTNERWFNNSIKCTFIEPYPDLLHSLLKEDDTDRVEIIPTRVQDVDPSIFKTLGANDILFVDSTHVSKIGSDVNDIFFNVLPSLAPGVLVHFHDIFYPFEYPKAWAEAGRAWNEAYLLRAFLQSNSDFEIVMFNTFLQHFHKDYFALHMPLCLKNTGASIWLRKRSI